MILMDLAPTQNYLLAPLPLPSSKRSLATVTEDRAASDLLGGSEFLEPDCLEASIIDLCLPWYAYLKVTNKNKGYEMKRN